MKTLFFFLLLPFIALGQKSFDKQGISKEVLAISKKIAANNVLAGSAVGYSGQRPEQYNNFEKLKERASTNELIKLTNHPNGVVRCYAFFALLEIANNEIIYPIVLSHLNDTTIVETFYGCIVSESMVGDIFIRDAIYEDEETPSKLNPEQINIIDSLIINQDSKLWYRDTAIEQIKFNESNYEKIRDLAVKEHNNTALVRLAEYKRSEDLNIFKKYFSSASKNEDSGDNDNNEQLFYFYKIVEKYPHPDFFPFLQSELEKIMDDDHFGNEWVGLYTAIAAYQNNEALALLKKPFTDVQHKHIKKYHLDFIETAIITFPSPLYDELLWKIWEENNIITLDVYTHLNEINPEKAYNIGLKSLYFEDNSSEFSYIPDDIIELILKNVYDKDGTKANEIIINNIENCRVLEFPIYTKYAKETHDIIYTKPLLKRLKTENNAHVYLEIVRTLITYNDTEINKSILEIRKENPNMNDNWGADALDTLLKENNIH
jgi:predicted CopG family antitoxin